MQKPRVRNQTIWFNPTKAQHNTGGFVPPSFSGENRWHQKLISAMWPWGIWAMQAPSPACTRQKVLLKRNTAHGITRWPATKYSLRIRGALQPGAYPWRNWQHHRQAGAFPTLSPATP